jgi:hypothetical protein
VPLDVGRGGFQPLDVVAPQAGSTGRAGRRAAVVDRGLSYSDAVVTPSQTGRWSGVHCSRPTYVDRIRRPVTTTREILVRAAKRALCYRFRCRSRQEGLVLQIQMPQLGALRQSIATSLSPDMISGRPSSRSLMRTPASAKGSETWRPHLWPHGAGLSSAPLRFLQGDAATSR